jgi:hypothetical protein
VKRFFGLVWSSAFLSVALSACVYDGDQRCGPHQQLIDKDRCICEKDYVPGASGCVPCGALESAVNGECVCVKGYARPEDGAACEPIPAALGAACDTEGAPCAAGPYPLCHVTEGTSGYCTNACNAGEACTGGYKCHEDGADSYCRRPPVGHGDTCASSDDCAGGEATFCETIQSNLCLVPCAAGKTDVCFEDELCCNFGIFEPICVPNNACVEKMGTPVQ